MNDDANILRELRAIREAVEAIREELNISGLAEACDAVRGLSASARTVRSRTGPKVGKAAIGRVEKSAAPKRGGRKAGLSRQAKSRSRG